MKLRRVRTHSGVQTQQLAGGQWQPLEGESPLGTSPFSDEWQEATADRHLQHTDSLLPFAPLSFRDFLLSEQHNINASPGMLKRFYPSTYRITRAVETSTRRTYPGFKPKKLFYQQPIYYFGNAMTIVPSGTPIAFPSYSAGLDFELELAWVLKAPLHNASTVSTRALQWDLGEVMAHASRDEHLLPGELFAWATSSTESSSRRARRHTS